MVCDTTVEMNRLQPHVAAKTKKKKAMLSKTGKTQKIHAVGFKLYKFFSIGTNNSPSL